MVRRQRATAGGGPAVQGNWRWVAVNDNRSDLIFLMEKIFSSHRNTVILYVRWECFGRNIDSKLITGMQYSRECNIPRNIFADYLSNREMFSHSQKYENIPPTKDFPRNMKIFSFFFFFQKLTIKKKKLLIKGEIIFLLNY